MFVSSNLLDFPLVNKCGAIHFDLETNEILVILLTIVVVIVSVEFIFVGITVMIGVKALSAPSTMPYIQ